VALWPNNFSDIRGYSPKDLNGSPAFMMSQQRITRNLAFFGNEVIEETASIPEGAFESPVCILSPLVGGGMSAGNSTGNVSLAGDGALTSGGAIAGTATIVFDEDGASLSLVITMSGTTTATITAADATLSLTIGLDGEATWTLTTSANLGLVVPFSGSGAFSITGAADLKGLLSMSGEATPFTELSPQSLAAAVWSAVATDNDAAGTMGEKLNDAGGAANPWTEVIDSGYTAAEILRMIASLAAAKSSGGTASDSVVTFRDLGDTKDRLTFTVDALGNRSAVVVDAS